MEEKEERSPVYLAVKLLHQNRHLLHHQTWRELRETDNERGDGLWSLGIIAVELLVADLSAQGISRRASHIATARLPQNLVGQLWIVVLLGKNLQELGHWLGQVVKV